MRGMATGTGRRSGRESTASIRIDITDTLECSQCLLIKPEADGQWGEEGAVWYCADCCAQYEEESGASENEFTVEETEEFLNEEEEEFEEFEAEENEEWLDEEE